MAYTLTHANRGIRSLPVSEEVARIYEQAARVAGIDEIRVTSGGQPASGPHRTGSHRHDLGGSGDIQLVAGGRTLDFTNPADLPIIEKFVAAAKGAGATGIGAGVDYMGPKTLHVGLGSPAVWGAGGSSANAPEWLKKAYGMTLTSVPPNAVQSAATAAPTEAAVPETMQDKVKTFLSGKGEEPGALDELAKVFSNKVDPQVAAATSEITPSAIGAAPTANPAAAQMLASLLEGRRKRYGMSLMG